MKRARMALVVLVVGLGSVFIVGNSDVDRTVVMRDDCDPDDPTWAPGPCLKQHGDVSFAEFNGELISPRSAAVIGHQAWRNDPSYLEIEGNDDLKVTNRGGRVHTFTEVAQFGGGFAPPLNFGLVPSPECATATAVAPGESTTVKGLADGNHRFQCCIHPWMRAVVKVHPPK